MNPTTEQTEDIICYIPTLQELQDDVAAACDEYRARLHNPDDITQSNVFHGMLLYAASVVITPLQDAITQRDITLLQNLWTIYSQLCASCAKTPTLVQFSTFVGVPKDLFYRWRSGVVSDKNKAKHLFAVNIIQACEAATLGRAIDSNSIGALFALKSVFGYCETQSPQVVELRQATATPTEITARYANITPPQIALDSELSDNLATAKATEKREKMGIVSD